MYSIARPLVVASVRWPQRSLAQALRGSYRLVTPCSWRTWGYETHPVKSSSSSVFQSINLIAGCSLFPARERTLTDLGRQHKLTAVESCSPQFSPHPPALYTLPLIWRSPHGHRFLRDHTGTRDVTRPDDPREPPDDPS